MKKIFTIVDEKRGIAQITTDDERFYVRDIEEDGEKKHIYLPSVTWITAFAPKGVEYYKWLAEHGWDESEAIKKDRGKYGSRVHKACEALLNGEEVKMESEFPDPDTNELKPLSFEEYNAVYTFQNWWNDLKCDTKEIVEIEYTVWNEEEGFAGTIDLIIKVDGEYWIVDLKTSKNVFLGHEIQVSAYRHSVDFPCRTFILQLGYARNKNGYKLTEIEDKYNEFKAAQTFWRNEHSGTKPFQKDYPTSLKLN